MKQCLAAFGWVLWGCWAAGSHRADVVWVDFMSVTLLNISMTPTMEIAAYPCLSSHTQ